MVMPYISKYTIQISLFIMKLYGLEVCKYVYVGFLIMKFPLPTTFADGDGGTEVFLWARYQIRTI